MSETPFDFGRELRTAARETSEEIARNQRVRRRAARAAAAESMRTERREATEHAELMAEWGRLDKRKLSAAQHAIRQIPVETAHYLDTNKVPFNINRRLILPGYLMKQRLRMWGHERRNKITESYTHPWIPGEKTIKRTGKYTIAGWGLTVEGKEYAFSGPERDATAKLAVPKIEASTLATQDLRTPDIAFVRGVLEAVHAGQAALSEYVEAEYDEAKGFYKVFALSKTL